MRAIRRDLAATGSPRWSAVSACACVCVGGGGEVEGGVSEKTVG